MNNNNHEFYFYGKLNEFTRNMNSVTSHWKRDIPFKAYWKGRLVSNNMVDKFLLNFGAKFQRQFKTSTSKFCMCRCQDCAKLKCYELRFQSIKRGFRKPEHTKGHIVFQHAFCRKTLKNCELKPKFVLCSKLFSTRTWTRQKSAIVNVIFRFFVLFFTRDR